MSREVEEWRVVPGWPAYQASDHGRAMSFWKRQGTREHLKMVIGTDGRLLVPGIEPKTGHLHVTLGNGEGTVQKTFKLARLVLMAFVRLPEPGEDARHIHDPDPGNNHLWNLAWGTRSDNWADEIRHHGKHHNAKLTADDVRAIRGEIALGTMQKDIAVAYGVSGATICMINQGKVGSSIY